MVEDLTKTACMRTSSDGDGEVLAYDLWAE
jgi:hypothetical protein